MGKSSAGKTVKTEPVVVAQTVIVEFNPFEQQLAEFKAQYVGVVYDLTDKKQEKQARSDAHKIGTIVAELDRTHAAVKAPLLERTKLLDGERKRIKDDLQSVQEGIRSQVKAHEAALQAIEDALAAKVQHIYAFANFPQSPLPTSEMVMDRLIDLSCTDIDASYAHYEHKAREALSETTSRLHEMFATVSQQEADAAELKRLQAEEAQRKQQEHDSKVAAAAALAATETARKAQEEAEQATAVAELRAREAERRADEAEKCALEKAAHDRTNDELAERIRSENEARRDENRNTVTLETVEEIAKVGGISLGAARKIFDAIAEEEIAHLLVVW